MIGIPYETPEMIWETINLNKRCAPSCIVISFFYPYPGTELYEVCQKEGFLSKRYSRSFVSESVLELPTVTKKELEKLYTEFYKCAIERRIQSFHPLLRFPLRVVSSGLLKILGKRAIEVFMKIWRKNGETKS